MQRFHQHQRHSISIVSPSPSATPVAALFCSQIISQIVGVSTTHYKEKKNVKSGQTPPALGKSVVNEVAQKKKNNDDDNRDSTTSSSLPIFSPAFTSNVIQSKAVSAKFLIDDQTLSMLATARKKTAIGSATTVVCSPSKTVNQTKTEQSGTDEDQLEKELAGNLASESAKIVKPSPPDSNNHNHNHRYKKITKHPQYRKLEPNLAFGNYFSNDNDHLNNNKTAAAPTLNENAQRQKAILQIKRLFRKVFQVLNIEHQNFVSQVVEASASSSSSNCCCSWYSEPTLRTNSERFPPRFYSSAVVWKARRSIQVIFPEVKMHQPQSDVEAVAMCVAMMTIAKAETKNSLFKWMAESAELFERFSMPESFYSKDKNKNNNKNDHNVKKKENEEILFQGGDDGENAVVVADPPTLFLLPAPIGAILKISDFYTNQDALLFSSKKAAESQYSSNNNTNNSNINVNHYIAPLNNSLLDKLDHLCDATDLTMELQFFILKSKHNFSQLLQNSSSKKGIANTNHHDQQYFIRGVAIFRNAFSNVQRKSFTVERSTMDKVLTEITQKFETFVVEERSSECKTAELVEVTKSIKLHSVSAFSQDSRNFPDSGLMCKYWVHRKDHEGNDNEKCCVELQDQFGNKRILSSSSSSSLATNKSTICNSAATIFEEKVDELTDRLLLTSSFLSPTPSRLRNKLTSLKWMFDQSNNKNGEETQITITKNLGFSNDNNNISSFRINLESTNDNHNIIATELVHSDDEALIDSVVSLISVATEQKREKMSSSSSFGSPFDSKFYQQELVHLLSNIKNFVPLLLKIKFPSAETLCSYNPAIILQPFEFARSCGIAKLLSSDSSPSDSTVSEALSMTEKEIGFSPNDFENALFESCGFLFSRSPRSLKKNHFDDFKKLLLSLVLSNQDWIVDKRKSKNSMEKNSNEGATNASCLSKFISLSPSISRNWIHLQAQRLVPFTLAATFFDKNVKNSAAFLAAKSQTTSSAYYQNSHASPTSLVDLFVAIADNKNLNEERQNSTIPSQVYHHPLALISSEKFISSYWGWPPACHQIVAKLFASIAQNNNNQAGDVSMPLHFERTDFLGNGDPFIRATVMKKLIVDFISKKLETTEKNKTEQDNNNNNNSDDNAEKSQEVKTASSSPLEILRSLPSIYDPRITSSRNLDEISAAKMGGSEKQEKTENVAKNEVATNNYGKIESDQNNDEKLRSSCSTTRIIFKSAPPKRNALCNSNVHFETFSNFDSGSNSLEWCGAATLSSAQDLKNDNNNNSVSSPATGHLSKNPLVYWRILQPASFESSNSRNDINSYPLASAFELFTAAASITLDHSPNNSVLFAREESIEATTTASLLEKILDENFQQNSLQNEEETLLFLLRHLSATWLNLGSQFVASIQIQDIFVDVDETKKTKTEYSSSNNINNNNPSQKRQTLKPLLASSDNDNATSINNTKQQIYSYSVVTISLPSSSSSKSSAKSENVVCGVGKSRKLALEDALQGNFGACVIFPNISASSSKKFKVEFGNKSAIVAPTHELLIMYQLLILLTTSAGCQSIPTVRAKMLVKEENKKNATSAINDEVSKRLQKSSQKNETDEEDNENNSEDENEQSSQNENVDQSNNKENDSTAIEYVNKYAKFTSRIEYFLPTMKLLNNKKLYESSSSFYKQGGRKFSANWHRTHLHEFSHESMMEAAKFALLGAVKALLVEGLEVKSDTQAGTLLRDFASSSKTNKIEMTNEEIIFYCENAKMFLPDEMNNNNNNFPKDIWSPTFALRKSLGESLHFTVTQVEHNDSPPTYKARCYMSQSYPTLNAFVTNFSSENFVVDVAHSTTNQSTPTAAIDDLLWKILNGPLRDVEKTVVAMRKFKFFLQNPAVCCVMGWKQENELKVEMIPDFESCCFGAKLVKKENSHVFHEIISNNNNPNKKCRRKSEAFAALIDEVVEKVLEEEPELQDLLESACERRKCFFDETATQHDAFYQHIVRESNDKFVATSGSKNNRTLKFSLQHSLRCPHAFFAATNESEKNLLQIMSDMICQFAGKTSSNPIEFRKNVDHDDDNDEHEKTISLFFFGKCVQTGIPLNLPAITTALMNSTKKFLLLDDEQRVFGEQLWRKFCLRRSYLVHKLFGHAGLNSTPSSASTTNQNTNSGAINTSQASNSHSNSKSATYNNTTLFGGNFYSSQAAVSMNDTANFQQAHGFMSSSLSDNNNNSGNIPAETSANNNLDLTSKDGLVNLILAFCFGAKLKDRNLFQNTTANAYNNDVLATHQVESLKVDPEALFPMVFTKNGNEAEKNIAVLTPIKVFDDLNLFTERKQKYKARVYSEFVNVFDEMLGTVSSSTQESTASSAPENNNQAGSMGNLHLFSGRRLLCVFDEKDYSHLVASCSKSNMECSKPTTMSIANINKNFSIPPPTLKNINSSKNPLKSSAIKCGLSKLSENEALLTQLSLIQADSVLSSLRNILAVLFCHHHSQQNNNKDNVVGTVFQCVRVKPSFISSNLLIDSERYNNTQNAILESADVQFGLFYHREQKQGNVKQAIAVPILLALKEPCEKNSNHRIAEDLLSLPRRCRIPSPLIRKQIRLMRMRKLSNNDDPNDFVDDDDVLELDHVDYGPSLFRFYAETIYQIISNITITRKSKPENQEENVEDFLQEIIRLIAFRNEWSGKAKSKFNLQNATALSHALLEILYGRNAMIQQISSNYQTPVLLAANNNSQLVAEILQKVPANANVWGCCTSLSVDGFLKSSSVSASSSTCVSFGIALRKNDSVSAACKEALTRHGFDETSNLVSVIQSCGDKTVVFDFLK